MKKYTASQKLKDNFDIDTTKDDDDFDKECSLALTHEEAKAESIRRIKKHFERSIVNIHIKKNNS